MKRTLAIEIICFLFIVLFLYAAGSKLTEYYKFIGQMSKSPLITDHAETLAWAVPGVEIVAAIMLIIPRTKLMGLYVAFGLMTLFSFYIITILSISKELPCSCGGILSTMMGWREHLVFNIAFVLLALTGIILTSRESVQKPATTQKTTAYA